jgi:GTP-binding protein Era
MNFQENGNIKTGIAALVGPPNVGKSTLLNCLLGQKISIVSPKPQTTRNRILGIINDSDYQIVMLDTPGLHEASNELNKEMVKLALESLKGVEVVLFIVDAKAQFPKKAEYSPTKYLAGLKTPAILLINKVDLLDKQKILPLIQRYEKLHNFAAIIPISAKLNDGTDLLIKEVIKLLPTGPRLYPEDIPTDATERFIVGETIREKIFLVTGQEIPYSTAVMVDSFQEREDGSLVTIHATIFLERQSQKGMVIGKGGKKLGEIGTAARKDIEKLLDKKVHLKLWVKVKKNWTKNSSFLKELGF